MIVTGASDISGYGPILDDVATLEVAEWFSSFADVFGGTNGACRRAQLSAGGFGVAMIGVR